MLSVIPSAAFAELMGELDQQLGVLPPAAFPKLKREINRDTQRGWIVSTEKDFDLIKGYVSGISKGEYVAKKKEEVIAERKIAKGITKDTFFRTTVLTGSAADLNDAFFMRAVAYNRGLGKISGKMEFHSTYTQNGRFILKVELDAKGVEEFERSDEGGLDSTLYLFGRGSFKLTANPRFGSSGAARSAGAAGAAAAGTEQVPPPISHRHGDGRRQRRSCFVARRSF